MGFGSGFGVNFTASTRFKSSGGGPAIDLTDWGSRRLDGNSAGDLGVGPNGSLYRWSTALNEWIQAWIYDLGGTFVLDCKIDGGTLPAGETPAWVENHDASADDISTDGTHVTIDSSDHDTATYLVFDHGQTNANHFLIGYISSTATTGGSTFLHQRLQVRTNSRDVLADIAGVETSTNICLTDAEGAGSTETGYRLQNVAMTTEKWVELYCLPDDSTSYLHEPSGAEGLAYLYADHKLVAIGRLETFGANSQTRYIIGDANGNVRALTKLRNIKCGRWA
jgi:hypothetical protein